MDPPNVDLPAIVRSQRRGQRRCQGRSENITMSLHANKHAVGVFLGIEKAFNTIDQNILHRK